MVGKEGLPPLVLAESSGTESSGGQTRLPDPEIIQLEFKDFS
jgi:hypothetical protein